MSKGNYFISSHKQLPSNPKPPRGVSHAGEYITPKRSTMNLLFHDRTTTQQPTGRPTLSIEQKGIFTLSSAACAAANLRVGSAVALAQDTDTNDWYLITNPGITQSISPFHLRNAGGCTSTRLCFSSATHARIYFQEHELNTSSVHLALGFGQRIDVGGSAQLWPLQPVTKVTKEAKPLPMPARVPATVTDTTREYMDAAEQTRNQAEAEARRQRLSQPWANSSVPSIVPAATPKPVIAKAAKAAKPAPATEKVLRPKPENHQPEGDGIPAGLETKFLSLVKKYGPMKLYKIPVHEAKQALMLLTTHVDLLAWVPGAERLRERLAGFVTLPTHAAPQLIVSRHNTSAA